MSDTVGPRCTIEGKKLLWSGWDESVGLGVYQQESVEWLGRVSGGY